MCVLDLCFDACSAVLAVALLCRHGRRWSAVFRTFEYSDGSWEVVDPSSSLQGSCDNTRRGDQVVCECVVQVPLDTVRPPETDLAAMRALPVVRRHPAPCRTLPHICQAPISHLSVLVIPGVVGKWCDMRQSS